MQTLRLMAVLAHPDDESLGFGGTLAKYAAEGVETFLVTATRGDAGRYRGHPRGHELHPGPDALAAIRERDCAAAAAVLGVRDFRCSTTATGRSIAPTRGKRSPASRVRCGACVPHVVMTFAPDGAYGHPDHIAISQFTSAAMIAAADPRSRTRPTTRRNRPTPCRSCITSPGPQPAWAAYQEAFKKLVSPVDGVERQAVPWPEWAITTVIDTRDQWETVWRAVSCHESQIAGYERLKTLAPEHHEALWGHQTFYRVFSTVNGGRTRETDLFEGLR